MNDEPKSKVAVLCSGGIDCTATLLTALHSPDVSDVLLVNINYGQKTSQRERLATERIAGHCKLVMAHLALNKCLDLSQLFMGVKDFADQDQKMRVPYRNTLLIVAAVAYCTALEEQELWIGCEQRDYADYPDCRPEYFKALNETLQRGAMPGHMMQVVAPRIQCTKTDNIKYIAAMDPELLKLTWSCYRNEDYPCGQCASCIGRAQAFKEAGIVDPCLNATS